MAKELVALKAEVTELAESLEDLGHRLAWMVDDPENNAILLAVATAGYALRRVGDDAGAVWSYQEEDDIPSWVALENQLRAILPTTENM